MAPWLSLQREVEDLIIANLSPEKSRISRVHLIDATNRDPGRPVVLIASRVCQTTRSTLGMKPRDYLSVSAARQRVVEKELNSFYPTPIA